MPSRRRTLHCLPDRERWSVWARASSRVTDKWPRLALVWAVWASVAAAAASNWVDGLRLGDGPFRIPASGYATGALMGLGLVGWHALVRRLAARYAVDELRGRGLCDCCGYDLRASPGRCPECGAGPEGVA